MNGTVDNPAGLFPLAESETNTLALLDRLATAMGYTTTRNGLDYTKRINTHKLHHELKHVQKRFQNGIPDNITRDLFRIANELNVTLTDA